MTPCAAQKDEGRRHLVQYEAESMVWIL